MKTLQADTQHSSRPLDLPLPITALSTPALLVDGDRLRRNLQGMQTLARSAGVRLRPHAKSHKCAELARRQIEAGATGLCTAKVSEAAALARTGLEDLLVAYPVLGEKAADLAALAARHPRGAFAATADSERGLHDLGRAASRHGVTLGVWLEVDVGLHRCGLHPRDPRLEVLARRARSTAGIRLLGLLTHAGHVYAAPREAAAGIGREEGESLVGAVRRLERAGLGPLRASLGATPTVAAAARVDGVYEIHPGVYVFGDRQQVHLGSMSHDEVCLSVLATVVSAPSSGRWVVDAGSKTLSSDRGAHGTTSIEGYGMVRSPCEHRRMCEDVPLPFTLRAPGAEPGSGSDSPILARLSEEHGMLEHPDGPQWAPGDRVEIIPNHACPVVNLADALYVTEGEGEERRAVARWPVTARSCVR